MIATGAPAAAAPLFARRDPTPWIVGALTLVALALRLPGALAWWFNPDEAIYWRVATAEAEQAWRLVAGNAHPPLFYAILRGIARVEAAPFALRLPALIAGVALVPMTALLARRLFGRVAACAAALWVALAPAAIMLSQVARPYMLQSALLCAAAIGLADWLHERRARSLWLYTMSLLLALYVHYGSLVVLGGATATLLVLASMRRFERREWQRLALVHALLFAACAWLYFTHIAPRLAGSEMQAVARQEWLEPYFVDGSTELRHAVVGAFGLAFYERGTLALAVAALGCAVAWRAGRAVAWLLPVASLGCALCLSILALYPLGLVRHGAYLIPLLVPPVAGGVGWLLGRANWPARLVGAALLAFLTLGALKGTLALLRGDGSAGMVPEGVVRHDEVQRFERFWRERLPAGALILTDDQTLQLLAALLKGEIAPFERRGDTRLSRTTIDGRALWCFGPADEPATASPWILPWLRSELDQPAHLAGALAALAADPELHAAAQAHGLWFVQGGWKPNLFHGDRSVRVDSVYHEAAGGPGLGLFRLHAPAYRAYLAGN